MRDGVAVAGRLILVDPLSTTDVIFGECRNVWTTTCVLTLLGT